MKGLNAAATFTISGNITTLMISIKRATLIKVLHI